MEALINCQRPSEEMMGNNSMLQCDEHISSVHNCYTTCAVEWFRMAGKTAGKIHRQITQVGFKPMTFALLEQLSYH